MIHHVIETSIFIAQPIEIHSGQLHSNISGVCHHMLIGTWAEEDCHLTLLESCRWQVWDVPIWKIKGL